MEQFIEQDLDGIQDLDGEAAAARMRAESEAATLAYGVALQRAGHIDGGWRTGEIDRPAPWKRAAESIGGRYGVSLRDMLLDKSTSRTPRARLVARARDHVFFVLHREHGLKLAVIAALLALRSPATVSKGALRHARRGTGGA